MSDLDEATSDQLLGRVAGDLAQGAVDERPAAVEADQPGADRRPFEYLLEMPVGGLRETVGGTARGDVEDHRHAAGYGGGHTRVARRAVDPQRPDVDHQRAAVLGAEDLARTRLAVERRAKQRLDQLPEARGKRVADERSRVARGQVACRPVRASARRTG